MKELMTGERNGELVFMQMLKTLIKTTVEEVINGKLKEANQLEVETDSKELLTTEESAMIAKVKPTTVRTWCRDNRIKYSRIGRNYRIRKSDLTQFLATKNIWLTKV